METPNILRHPLGDPGDFSVARAAYALAQQKATRSMTPWDRYAPFEKAWLEAEFKTQGDQVSTQDGGALAPEDWGTRYFELLRSFGALDRLPVVRASVPYRVEHLPKITNDVTVYYPGENASITASQYKFGQLTYSARKASIRVVLSNEMIRDAPELADRLLRQSGARAMAVDRDTQALTAQPGAKPAGIIYTPEVPGANGNASFGASGPPLYTAAAPTYANFAQWKYQVETLNAGATGQPSVSAGQAACDGAVGHTRLGQIVHALTGASSGDPMWPWDLEAFGGFLGIKTWALTNVMPQGTTSGYIVFGSWSSFVIFDCLQLGFDATMEGQGFASDETEVRLLHRWDAGAAQPEAFVVISGVT